MITPVSSSLISAIDYTPETRELIVFWAKGGQQNYYDVPQSVHDEFVRSESVGKFYNANIKGRYGKVEQV